ncbi:MAG TPA: hypothetical protein VGL86_28720 [Polyangia bacterium]
MMRSFVAFAAASVVAALAAPAQAHVADLERLRQAEVVVVRGSADHMEHVMQKAQVKFVVVDPEDLPQLPLHGQQVLMVNCTGEMSAAARERVRRFVNAGGFLYTTDHAVHYLLERAFPGYVKWSGKTSNEEIFPMEVGQTDRGLLKKLGNGGHPRWQTAGGGYLFDVVDKQHVDVLMSSRAVAAKYGGSGVLGVRFRVGDGQIIHVTGHFFTQPGQSLEVASAGRSFEQLSANVAAEKAADRGRLQGLYNVAPAKPMPMQSAPEPTAAAVAPIAGNGAVTTTPARKVRVLDKKGSYSHVRDDEGNEGWVPTDSL